MNKSVEAFRTISEVANELAIAKHVLRFWESRFPQIKPMKRGGGRRYYRPEDMALLRGIRHLLHSEGYTIRGVQKILRQQGVETVKQCWQPGAGAVVPEALESGLAMAASKKRGEAKQPKTRLTTKKASVGQDPKSVVRAAIKELEACRKLLASASVSTQRTTPQRRASKARV